jgi:hypothetical protein
MLDWRQHSWGWIVAKTSAFNFEILVSVLSASFCIVSMPTASSLFIWRLLMPAA